MTQAQGKNIGVLSSGGENVRQLIINIKHRYIDNKNLLCS